MTANELVAEVQDVIGSAFPDDDVRILRWANVLYRILVTRSRWSQAIMDLGPTVADQSTYDVPANVHQLLGLQIGTTPYIRGGVRQGWEFDNNLLVRNTTKGFFVPAFTDDTTDLKQIKLFPTPTSAGDEINAWGVVYPSDVSGTESFDYPEEYTVAHIDGVASIIKRWGDEINDESVAHSTEFNGAIEMLRRDANKRISSGPIQMGIIGKTANL